MLNGQCSRICGGASPSFREEHLTLSERGEMDVLKINNDDDHYLIISSETVGKRNSTAAEEVCQIQCLFPNPSWLVRKDIRIQPPKTHSNIPMDRQLPDGD